MRSVSLTLQQLLCKQGAEEIEAAWTSSCQHAAHVKAPRLMFRVQGIRLTLVVFGRGGPAHSQGQRPAWAQRLPRRPAEPSWPPCCASALHCPGQPAARAAARLHPVTGASKEPSSEPGEGRQGSTAGLGLPAAWLPRAAATDAFLHRERALN